MNINKLKAAGKIAFGIVKIGGGVATVTGHGVLHVVAAACKVRIPHPVLVRIAKEQFTSGGKTFEDGVRDWEKCK